MTVSPILYTFTLTFPGPDLKSMHTNKYLLMLPCQTPFLEPNKLIETFLQMIFDIASNIKNRNTFFFIYFISLLLDSSFVVTRPMKEKWGKKRHKYARK